MKSRSYSNDYVTVTVISGYVIFQNTMISQSLVNFSNYPLYDDSSNNADPAVGGTKYLTAGRRSYCTKSK
jgi:hypothetical protein